MKRKYFMLFIAAILVCSLAMSSVSLAWWNGDMESAVEKLLNTQTFKASDINEIKMSYGTDNIYIIPADTQDIVLKEYMSKEDAAYKAAAGVQSHVLTISSGERPKGQNISFSSHVELIVPVDYKGEIKISTLSGSIFVTGFAGRLQLETASGNINAEGFTGEGSFQTKSGNVNVRFDKGAGTAAVKTASGNVAADIQSDAAFKIQADTGSGKIDNQFSDTWKAERRGLSGSWGNNPDSTIGITTASGNITLRQFKMTTIPVNFDTMKKGQIIWLGEYEFFQGKHLLYNVSVKSGDSVEIGLTDVKDDSMNVRYYCIKNSRTDEQLKVQSDIAFTETLKPAGVYRLYIRASGSGALGGVAGDIKILEYLK